MAKYVCLNDGCRKTFVETGKITTTKQDANGDTVTTTIPVCPHCASKEFMEGAKYDDVLVDMTLVDFSQVQNMLAQGYRELDRGEHVFSKGLVMIKTKPVEQCRADKNT